MATRSIKYTLIDSNRKETVSLWDKTIQKENCNIRNFLLKIAFIWMCILILIFYNIKLFKNDHIKFISKYNETHNGFEVNNSDQIIRLKEIIPTKPINIFKASKNEETMAEKFFVRTENCMIPYVNPFTDDLNKIYKPLKPISCGNGKSIIRSAYNISTGQYILHINEDVKMKLLKSNGNKRDEISCCYRKIIRPENIVTNADDQFKLLSCTHFHQGFQLPTNIDAIIVECKSKLTKKLLQKDAFSFIQYRPQNHQKVTDHRVNKKRPNVLLIGIDSLSKINLRRTMPKTFAHLVNSKWFELEGYNKVGDNTYPNLMALLTGLDSDMAFKICKPFAAEGLNNCDFIWNHYKEGGYHTAYAEDEAGIGTFNFQKKGFHRSPTDYYLRPFIQAIEKELPVKKMSGLPYCIGRRQYAEYIYDYALEFAIQCNQRNSSGFGLFWTNSFSHNNYEDPARMDVKVRDYLLEFERNHVLETSIVIFFSDHGSRFGPLLELPEGFLENRLPMFFIWLPKWFQESYPVYVNALEINRHRLSSPYDIYMTLKHLLLLNADEWISEDNKQELMKPPKACPGCQSIFYELSSNRTCADAGITDHWCTCQPYQTVSNSKFQKNIARLILNEMDSYIKGHLIPSCKRLTLKSIKYLEKRIDFIESNSLDGVYKMEFVTKELARFEITFGYNHTSQKVAVNVENGISRLDSYEKTGKCILDKDAKKYCICK